MTPSLRSLSRRVIDDVGIGDLRSYDKDNEKKSLVRLSGPMPALQRLEYRAIHGKHLEVRIKITAPRLRAIYEENFQHAHGSIQIRGSEALEQVESETFEKFNVNDVGDRSVFSEPEDDG